MDPEAAKLAEKYAGKAGKKFESLTDPPKPEIDPTEKARLANTSLRTTKFLSQEAYFNPDKINDYGRRDAGPEIELFDPDTRIPVARIAREPKSGGPAIWQSSNYNPDLEYQQVTKDGYISEIDPQTGREVARTANLVGGADDGEIPPTKPPAPADGTGGGDLPPSGPSVPTSAEGGGPPENPYDQYNYMQLEEELVQKRNALAQKEHDAAINSFLAGLPKTKANLEKLRAEVAQIEDSKNRLLEDEQIIEMVPHLDSLIEQEVDYRLREGQPLSTSTGADYMAYDELQSFLRAETEEEPNVFENPRLKGFIKDRYKILTKEYEEQFAEQLTPTPEEPSTPDASTGSPPPDDRRDDGSPDGGLPPTAPAAPPVGVPIITVPPTETMPPGPSEPPTDASPEGPPPPPSNETFASLQAKIDPLLRVRSRTPEQEELLNKYKREQDELVKKYITKPEANILIQTAYDAIDALVNDEVANLIRTNEPISDPTHIAERETLLQSYLAQYPDLNGYLRQVYKDWLKTVTSRHQAEIDTKRAAIEHLRREEIEAQERRHREQIEAIEANRKAISAKEYPHDEFISNPDPTVRREYIENLLYDYEHFSNGITAGDIAKLKEAMTRLKLDKELIDVLDARKALQEAAGHVPIEGSMNIDEWEKSMKGLFVAEGYPLKLLIGGDWVDKVTGKKISDKDLDIIAADLQRPPHERQLEWKKKELIPGLSEALTLLQTETHQETMEVDKIDFSTSPPRFIPDQKIKLTVTCNFVQGDSSQANVSRVKKIYEAKLKAKFPRFQDKDKDKDKERDREVETAIHLAERLLRVTLISAKMNGPLQMNHAIEVQKVVEGRPAVRTDGKEDTKTVEDYRIAANLDLASRRIKLSLNLANNTPKLVNGVSQSSEWDTIYDGSHPTIKIDTSASMAGVIKGRGSGLRESLYFPSFLEQRDLGGYPELRRLANLRVADLLPHFSEQAKNILVDDPVTGAKNKPGEVTDFDTFIKIYSTYSFANKQNVLYFWVDNIKNAMDKRSLFYSDPKESGKSVTGLVADPVSFSTREKIVDLDLDYRSTRDDGDKEEPDTKQALEKYLKALVDLGNEFASKYAVAYSGVPKDKANQLIWLEQQFLQFISSETIGKKYFHHRSIKARGKDLPFYLGPKALRAFQYGFYKSEIIQNINEQADPAIFALADATIQASEPAKESTGTNFLTNASHPANIILKALSGNYKQGKK